MPGMHKFSLPSPDWITQCINTVNRLNLTAVKIRFLKTQTYLAQENLAF